MRRSYDASKLARHNRKPAELLLVPDDRHLHGAGDVPADDRRVLPHRDAAAEPAGAAAEFTEPPPGLQLEVMVRKDLLQVADRNTRPARDVPQYRPGLRLRRPHRVPKRVKAKFPDKTDATVLLETDTPYDTLVQVMDHVRVFESGRTDRAGGAVPISRSAMRPLLIPAHHPSAGKGCAPMTVQPRAAHGQHHLRHQARCRAEPDSSDRHPLGDGVVPAGVLHRGRGHPEQQGHRDPAVDRADRAASTRWW